MLMVTRSEQVELLSKKRSGEEEKNKKKRELNNKKNDDEEKGEASLSKGKNSIKTGTRRNK